MRRPVLLALGVALAVSCLAQRSASSAPSPQSAVPILMYHVIGAPTATPYPGLAVSAPDFSSQVRWLAAHGYHAVTLARVYEHWQSGTPLPGKPIVLSFDDGYPGVVDIAMPLLRQRGWSGVLNLHIGNLVPARVRMLTAAGWEIDSHTFSHSDLRGLSEAELRHDVTDSRKWIQRVFRQDVLFFCYPSGRFNARVVHAVRAAGYVGATTTRYGLASPQDGMYTLDRVRVPRGLSGAQLGAELRKLETAE